MWIFLSSNFSSIKYGHITNLVGLRYHLDQETLESNSSSVTYFVWLAVLLHSVSVRTKQWNMQGYLEQWLGCHKWLLLLSFLVVIHRKHQQGADSSIHILRQIVLGYSHNFILCLVQYQCLKGTGTRKWTISSCNRAMRMNNRTLEFQGYETYIENPKGKHTELFKPWKCQNNTLIKLNVFDNF